MAKYLSNRQQNLKIGIVSYTEDKTVLEVTGKVGIGTTNAQYSLDVVGDINFTGTFYEDGNQFVASRWTSGDGSEIYRLSNVGIGTTNPTRTLDVNGDIRVRGGLYDVNNQSGTSGQLLVSTATGVDWQDANAISVIQTILSTTLTGIEVKEEGVGIGTTFTAINFVGQNVIATGNNNIATITLTDNPVFNNLNASGISTLNNLEIDGYISIGNSTGNVNQVLSSTGIGITWRDFLDVLPQARTGLTTTATANQTIFSFNYTVGLLDVYVNGVKLSSGEFTASNGSTITLTEPTSFNDIVEFISFSSFGIGTSLGIGITGSSLTSVGTLESLNVSGSTTLSGTTTINRVSISTVGVNTTLQTGIVYVYLAGVTSLTLPPSPSSGDYLKIINRSGITTTVVIRNGSNIMGFGDDLELDELDGSFNFIYVDSSQGWVISR